MQKYRNFEIKTNFLFKIKWSGHIISSNQRSSFFQLNKNSDSDKKKFFVKVLNGKSNCKEQKVKKSEIL